MAPTNTFVQWKYVAVLVCWVILTPLFSALAAPEEDTGYEKKELDYYFTDIQEGTQLGGVEETGYCFGNACGGQTLILGTPVDTVALIVNVLLGLLGLLCLVIMIYAGWIWMMARGNQEDAKRAKDMITGTVIGMLVVLASYSFMSYVFESLVDITN